MLTQSKIFSLKKIWPLILLLLPIFVLLPFFVTSQFILLDDHEIFRLHFKELSIRAAIIDDWNSLNRFRPMYWVIRQTQSMLFGISPQGWYFSTWFILLLTTLFTYLFFKKLNLPRSTSVILSWLALLGLHSINSWLALGPQEGLALCWFSFSLLCIATFAENHKRKWYWLSITSLFAAVLTKETFIFASLFPYAFFLTKIKSKSWLKIAMPFLFIPIIISPVFLIKSWTLWQEKQTVRELTTWQLPVPHTFTTYINHLLSNPGVAIAFISAVFLIAWYVFRNLQKKRLFSPRKGVIIAIVAMSLLAQLVVFSFTDYIAPHYVQPLSFLTICFLALTLMLHQRKRQIFFTGLLSLAVPATIAQTVITANGHQYVSRYLKHVEQSVTTNSVKQVLFVGHQSYNYEAIYSFSTRIKYLYPSVQRSFLPQTSSYYRDAGQFDVGIEFEYSFDPSLPSLIISFSDLPLPQLGKTAEIIPWSESPLVPMLPASGTFYTVSPYTVAKI